MIPDHLSDRTMLRRLRFACAAFVGVVVSALVAPGTVMTPSAGATSTVPSTIALVSQTPWVRDTSGMKLEVAVHSQIQASNLGLQVTLFSQATERGFFEQSLSGNTQGFTPFPGGTAMMPLTTKGLLLANGDASLDLPVAAPGLPGKTQKAPSNGALLTIPCTDQCPGVYPLQVSLQDLQNTTTLDTFMTYLILAPALASSPLRFSWILPIGSTPATSPSGAARPSSADEQEVEVLRSEMASYPAASVSLALYPQFTKALAAAAPPKVRKATKAKSKKPTAAALSARRALTAVRSLVGLGNVEVEPNTFAPLDLAATAGANLGSEAADQLTTGRKDLSALGAKMPAKQFAAATPLGSRGLDLLVQNGVRRLVVPSGSVTPIPQSWVFPVWAPFFVKGTGVEADASDPYLERHLQSTSDPVLAANQLLADLAILYFVEQPPGNRGVSLLAPPGWRPDRQFVSTLLGGLSSSPIVQSDTMSQFFDQVPAASGEIPAGSTTSPLLYRGLQAPSIPASDQLPKPAIETARSRLDALASLLPKEPARIDQLHDLILLAETAGLSASTRLAYLGTVTTALDTEGSRVSLPNNRTITITSLSARIPISVYSTAQTPLEVNLRLSSPGLSFRNGGVLRTLLQPHGNTIEIQVSARTAGDFPLHLQVTTPIGQFTLASSRLLIRSTAISGVAVGLTAGAGAFLLIWWARSAVKRRRGTHSRKRGRRGAGVSSGAPLAPAAPAGTS